MRSHKLYESDDEAFPADAYRIDGHKGIAWYVLGWELEPVAVWFCQDCSRLGHEYDGGGGEIIDQGEKECDHKHTQWDDSGEPHSIRTGRVVCVMVGDDHRWTFDPQEIHALAREEYCGVCGQIGCGHDGLDRSEEDSE